MLNFGKTKKITVRNTFKKTIFLKMFIETICKFVMKKCSYTTIRNETNFYGFFYIIKFV